MLSTNRLIQLVGLVVFVASLGVSGTLSGAISAEAGRSQLVYTDVASEGDPPEVAFGIAMGAFRGLFVNYLWLRANRLKEEGKFHEAIELSTVITRLQPRFPRVWSFHAWNMAYNISVATNTERERWQWVSAGVDLLRSKGIPRNPNDVLLHKELAWIFFHKIQGFHDDSNRYYKQHHPREWTVVLGTPPALPDDPDAAVEVMRDWFRPIVEAPETLQGVIEDELAARSEELPVDGAEQPASMVAELARRLEQEAGLTRGVELLELTAIRRAIDEAWHAGTDSEGAEQAWRGSLQRDFAQRNLINETLDELLREPRYEDAWARLLPHVRKRVLVDEYRMEPGRMLRYTGKYGPLDWRHPAAHAIYWSQRGVELGLERKNATEFGTLNTDRVTLHSVQELFRTGTVVYDIVQNSHFTMLSTHYAPKYGELIGEFADRGGRSQDTSQRIFTTYGVGYQNFLADVTRVMFRLGRYEEAQEYFRKWRTNPYMPLNDPNDRRLAELPLDRFVQESLFSLEADDRVTIPHVAATEVETALQSAFLRGLLRDDLDIFQSNMRYARQVHEYYFKVQDQITLSDAARNRMDEMSPDFNQEVGNVFFRLLIAGEGAIGFAGTSRIYRAVSEDLQRLVYDNLMRRYMARGFPRDVLSEFFPEPSGMEEYRAFLEQLRQQGTAGDKRGLQFETQ